MPTVFNIGHIREELGRTHGIAGEEGHEGRDPQTDEFALTADAADRSSDPLISTRQASAGGLQEVSALTSQPSAAS